MKFSHNVSEDNLNLNNDSPNSYKHEFRSREKNKEIQPTFKIKGHDRFERMIDSIDVLERESPEFKYKLCKKRELNVNEQYLKNDEESNEIPIKNLNDFLANAKNMPIKQLNDIIRRIYPQ